MDFVLGSLVSLFVVAVVMPVWLPALLVIVAVFVLSIVVAWRGRDWVIGTSRSVHRFHRVCPREYDCVVCDDEERAWDETRRDERWL